MTNYKLLVFTYWMDVSWAVPSLREKVDWVECLHPFKGAELVDPSYQRVCPGG
jgi:hypothetical protein